MKWAGLLTLAMITAHQSSRFESDRTLWQSAVLHAQTLVRPRINLGEALLRERQDAAGSLAQLRIARDELAHQVLSPERRMAYGFLIHLNLGKIATLQGKDGEAYQWYSRAIETLPNVHTYFGGPL